MLATHQPLLVVKILSIYTSVKMCVCSGQGELSESVFQFKMNKKKQQPTKQTKTQTRQKMF